MRNLLRAHRCEHSPFHHLEPLSADRDRAAHFALSLIMHSCGHAEMTGTWLRAERAHLACWLRDIDAAALRGLCERLGWARKDGKFSCWVRMEYAHHILAPSRNYGVTGDADDTCFMSRGALEQELLDLSY